MLRIRLSRRGRKNYNVFAITVAEQKFRRDGRFVEKIGYYQPILKDTDPFRIHIDAEKYHYWVGQGAVPTEKVMYLAAKKNVIEMPKKEFTSTKKALPKKKAQERMKEAQAA